MTELQAQWFEAVANDAQAFMLSLLLQDVDINSQDDKQNTALHHAVKQVNLSMMKLLIDHGADLNAVNDWQSTPLHLTAKNINMIRLLLEAGANPNLKDKDWDYPYYFAFYGSMVRELTELYIKYGANLVLHE